MATHQRERIPPPLQRILARDLDVRVWATGAESRRPLTAPVARRPVAGYGDNRAVGTTALAVDGLLQSSRITAEPVFSKYSSRTLWDWPAVRQIEARSSRVE